MRGLVLTMIVFVSVNCQEANKSTACYEVMPERMRVLSGWPFQLDCEGHIQGGNSVCLVSSDGLQEQYSNLTLALNETSPNTTIYTTMQAVGTSCSRKTVEVEKVDPTTCRDDVRSYVTLQSQITYQKTIGDVLKLDCIPGPNEVLPPAVSARKYKTTWRRCLVDRNGTIIEEDACYNYSRLLDYRAGEFEHIQHDNKPDSIKINSVGYDAAAIFTCEIQYGGKSAFTAHHRVCIKNKLDYGKPSLNCKEVIEFFQGDDVTIECQVLSSNVQIKPGEMEVTWKKGSSALCSSSYKSNNGGPINCAFNCGEKDFLNLDQKCFTYIPSDHELTNYEEKKRFKIFLTIRGIKTSDEGHYVVSMRYRDQVSEPKTIELRFNNERQLKNILFILIFVLVFLLIICFMLAFIWYNWIQILLFARRHFGKYDEDGKEFAAILSYLYSDDLPELTKKRTKKIVKSVQETMNDINYKFYDSHQHFEQGSTVEILLKHLNESHRMIVILTDAYVEERWSRFEANQGLIEMMKKKSKLIVIRTPGAKRALKRFMKDDFSKELNQAIKASRNIHWKEKMSDERFKDELIYALPNLNRSCCKDESFKEDSCDDATYKKFDNYERSISNVTRTTLAPASPDSMDSFKFERSLNSQV